MDRFLTLLGPMVWPLATLIIALIFRRDVGQALGRIGQVKYRDLELTFRDDLHRAEQLARSIPPPAAKMPVVLEVEPGEPLPLVGRLIALPATLEGALDRPNLPLDLDAQGPSEAIEAAWGLVDRASRGKRRMASASPDLAALVGQLRTLRDRAAQPDQPTPSREDVRRFIDLARRVAAKLEEIN